MKITEELLAQLRAHGEETYPEECGGLLLGPSRGVVTELVPLVNQREDGSRHAHSAGACPAPTGTDSSAAGTCTRPNRT